MKITQLLLELNLIDQTPVDAWISDNYTINMDPDRPKIKQWWETKVKKYLMNSLKDNFLISDSNDLEDLKNSEDSPQWLLKAIERGDRLYEFSPGQRTSEMLDHIKDFFQSRDFEDDVYGLYNKLDKITVEQMYEKSIQWLEDIKKRGKKRQEQQLDDGDATMVKTIYSFDDGYKIVELPDDVCKTREGELMGHCVGSGGYGKATIFSLRDPKNQPHATMEVEGNQIVQLQGKGNKEVVEKYWPYVREFLNKTEYTLDQEYLSNVGLIMFNKEIISGDQLNSIFAKSDNLTVDGDLFLNNRMNIKSFPKTLTINGDLEFGRLNIELPENFRVNGNCSLMFAEIKKLPDNMFVNGSLDVSFSKINKLPKNLVVNGMLDIENTTIDALPNDLFVGIGLRYAHSNIKNSEVDRWFEERNT